MGQQDQRGSEKEEPARSEMPGLSGSHGLDLPGQAHLQLDTEALCL